MPMAPPVHRIQAVVLAYASGQRTGTRTRAHHWHHVIGGDLQVPFGGLIDEVRVWNRRLSDEELDA